MQSQSQSNQTPEYAEIIRAYQSMANSHPKVCALMEAGLTDSGKPLHIFVIDAKGTFDPKKIHDARRVVCLVMNGIHAGEPCGINASIQFAEEKINGPNDNVVYVIMPVYNIGGVLNRNSTSRANQNGPEEYGFRGNAKNLDLNRDFVKCDSQNAKSFTKLYHEWKPEIFIDTHTTNGADYQPAMTLISPSPEKLLKIQSGFLEKEFLPYLYKNMAEIDEEMLPYVDMKASTPDTGLVAFIDLPRYSMGYVGLFNTIGFTTEAHMLKSFDKRVAATLNFLHVLDTFLIARHDVITEIKRSADELTKSLKAVEHDWHLSDDVDSLEFAGFAADYKVSAVTGQDQLYYDKSRPYRKNVPYYKYNVAGKKIQLPKYYILQQAWTDVIDLLDINNVIYKRLAADSLIDVSATFIEKYETTDGPYEGHYMHSRTEAVSRKQMMQFYQGDILIPLNQVGNAYIAHVLEPECEDSFFNWNFFDSVLMQKEYFSAYVFDETATALLNQNNTIREAFEQKKAEDGDFASDVSAQLLFIYQNSNHYEKATHKRLPVFRIE